LVGTDAGANLDDGLSNVIIGHRAGLYLTDNEGNVAIGQAALDGCNGGENYNIAIGHYALSGDIAGSDNCVAIGRSALLTQNHSKVNMAIGSLAGTNITSGDKNVLVGHEAGTNLADDSENTAVGYNALKGSTAGSYNTAVGKDALLGGLTGSSNTAIGQAAMYTAAADMSDNVAVGVSALYHLNHANADSNVGIGRSAGKQTTDASPAAVDEAQQCVFIGADTESAANDRQNEIVIGYGGQGQGSNTIMLGNGSIGSILCADTSISAPSDRRVKRDVAASAVGLDFIDKLAAISYKRINPADYPDEIKENRLRERTTQELVSPAVEAADAVYEDVVVVEAKAAVEEVTETIEHPAEDAVYEDIVHPAEDAVYEDRVVVRAEAERTETRVVQEAREEITEERVTQRAQEEIKGERHKHDEREVTETVTREEIVEVDGKWVKREVSEEVTRIERTPLYDECDLYNEDGTKCDEKHCVPIMEEYIVQEAREEVREMVVILEAQDEITETITIPAVEEVTERVLVSAAVEEHTERRLVRDAREAWTETRVVTPASPAVEEVIERRLVKEAVEAKEAVYETVTVPADARPDDDDTVRLGLIAQDVQTAMTEAGVEFDLVNESPNGKLSLKYGNLVMPLIKAVQELSARVKTLEG